MLVLSALGVFSCKKELPASASAASDEDTLSVNDTVVPPPDEIGPAPESAGVMRFTGEWQPLAALPSFGAQCSGEILELSDPVFEAASQISADSLWYNSEPLSDCSGTFHRVLRHMKQQCPDHEYPMPAEYRDTRDLGRWYHEKGELVLIQDALVMADLIKPGAVMFYGYRDAVYENFAAEELFEHGSGIEHMGVVVSIDTLDDGTVKSYKLFHGRRPGTVAGVTNWHRREPSRSNYPPYGNGRQQWIAMARIVNPGMLPE